MSLEVLIGGKIIIFIRFLYSISLSLDNCSLSDFSDRYSNLKAAWDNLMEAASHGNPRSFQFAVTVVLEQLKREESRKQNKK
jgi:hypothetical protein